MVLKGCYGKAGDATALLQHQPEAPEVFDAPYKGIQSENGHRHGTVLGSRGRLFDFVGSTSSSSIE
jgi:hypothetical protein